MKYRLLLANIIVRCLATALQAQTATGVYGALRGSAGTAKFIGEDGFDMGTYGILPAVGYRFASFFRTELEFSARTKKNRSEYWDEFSDGPYDLYSSITYSVISLMAQCYIDIPLGKGPIQPFVNAGIGGTRGRVTAPVFKSGWSPDPDFDDSEDPLYPRLDGSSYNSVRISWNAGAGLAYIYDDRLSIEAMYRYSDLGNFRLDEYGTKTKIKLHDLVIGARFSF